MPSGEAGPVRPFRTERADDWLQFESLFFILYFWRDSRGLEIDLLIDLGTRRVPLEIKSGMTVAGDFFDALDRYTQLSGDENGVLVYGGDESYRRRNHYVRSWRACS